MDNLAYREDERYEILNGKVVAMSPRPSVNHNIVSGNIYHLFRKYLNKKSCIAFNDGVDVNLSENDRVIPDVMIVCNKDIIKSDGIYGAPDLVVEVLSPSTAKNDRGYKKDLYEKSGVKEYWIVNAIDKSIEVHLLENKKFKLDEVYTIYPDYMIKKMTDEEKADVKTKIKVSLYDDLFVNLEEIFEKLI